MPERNPLERKLAYIRKLASPEGVDLAMRTWESHLDLIQFSIGYNVLLRILMDLFLNLCVHLPGLEFEWWPVEFTEQFSPPFPKIEKAYYGRTKYNQSYYDPEQVTGENLERQAWEVRYRIDDKSYPFFKQTSLALIRHLRTHKDLLERLGIKREYLDAMEELLSLVEGKLLFAAYVGFTMVGLGRVMVRKGSGSVVPVRDPRDWKTVKLLESLYVFENHVGHARVGYARVMSLRARIRRELVEKIVEAIREFRQRSGIIQVAGTQVLYQRVFFLQRTERMKERGGFHQIRMGNLANAVRRILDKYGVIGPVRGLYHSFARELMYFKYKGHKRWKWWKGMLSADDIVEKYLRMDLDPRILSEIRRVVGV